MKRKNYDNYLIVVFTFLCLSENYTHSLFSFSKIGKKAPTIATFVSERSIRPQGFSKSFQNVNPKNSSLNTSMTKSNVHPNLDPQFA